MYIYIYIHIIYTCSVPVLPCAIYAAMVKAMRDVHMFVIDVHAALSKTVCNNHA